VGYAARQEVRMRLGAAGYAGQPLLAVSWTVSALAAARRERSLA